MLVSQITAVENGCVQFAVVGVRNRVARLESQLNCASDSREFIQVLVSPVELGSNESLRQRQVLTDRTPLVKLIEQREQVLVAVLGKHHVQIPVILRLDNALAARLDDEFVGEVSEAIHALHRRRSLRL